jgi:hypothetical protein
MWMRMWMVDWKRPLPDGRGSLERGRGSLEWIVFVCLCA